MTGGNTFICVLVHVGGVKKAQRGKHAVESEGEESCGNE